MEKLYDLVINCRDRYKGLTEDQVWAKIGSYQLGACYVVYHTSTSKVADEFVPY